MILLMTGTQDALGMTSPHYQMKLVKINVNIVAVCFLQCTKVFTK